MCACVRVPASVRFRMRTREPRAVRAPGIQNLENRSKLGKRGAEPSVDPRRTPTHKDTRSLHRHPLTRVASRLRSGELRCNLSSSPLFLDNRGPGLRHRVRTPCQVNCACPLSAFQHGCKHEVGLTEESPMSGQLFNGRTSLDPLVEKKKSAKMLKH